MAQIIMNMDDDAWADYTKSNLTHVNVGTGVDLSIKELAETIADTTGFKGHLISFIPSIHSGDMLIGICYMGFYPLYRSISSQSMLE